MKTLCSILCAEPVTGSAWLRYQVALSFPRIFGYTTTRLILLVFASQILATGAILFVANNASERTLVTEQKAFVDELRIGLLAHYQSNGLDGLASEIERRLQLNSGKEAVILLALADGEIVAGNLTAWPLLSGETQPWTVIALYRKGADAPEPVGIIKTALPGGAQLLTGHILTASERLNRINNAAMISAFLLAIPVTLLFAVIFVKLVNQRVRTISSISEAVRAGDMSRRIEISGRDGAFDELSRGINAMLDRIEALVSELRIVTDGLAHDLRSPITRLKSVVEHAIVETEDETALKALDRVSTEAESLLTMLTTALQISRAEAGIGKEQFAKTAIAPLLTDLAEVYGPLAEDHGIALESSAPEELAAFLHRQLIGQILGNLIENALKYAEGADQIRLSAVDAKDHVILSVADNGKGIPKERRAEAQKRFGRLDPARKTSGSGLGLSLVEAVIKLHDGQVSLHDNQPGLRVDLTILK